MVQKLLLIILLAYPHVAFGSLMAKIINDIPLTYFVCLIFKIDTKTNDDKSDKETINNCPISIPKLNENKDKNSVNISLKFRSRNTGNTGNVSFSIQQTAP